MSAVVSPAPATSTWCLRFLSGAVRGRTIALKPGANSVGSDGHCEVMLPGGDVLPQHLVITVGELVVSLQRVGLAAARLNGEELRQPRRSVVAGDVVTVGGIDFQLDRNYPAADSDERRPGWSDSMLSPAAEPTGAAPAPARPATRWMAGGVVVLVLLAVAALVSWDGAAASRPASAGVNLGEVEKALATFGEVEAVAGPSGSVSLRGYVESRARRQALRDAVARFGPRVHVNVLGADEIVEQARRFVSDPGVAIAYAGHGRLVVSGTVDDEAVRQQIRRLTEDLHPTVLVSDKVQVRARTGRDANTDARAQWSAWQDVLPARMVGITEDANGLRHIQLANGSRYYEGSVLRSGGELERIDADGLVIRGGKAKAAP